MSLLQIGKEAKLKVFICFTFLFFLLELISGYYSGSVALIADAFHMLSDVAALFIALYATKVIYFSSCNICNLLSFLTLLLSSVIA